MKMVEKKGSDEKICCIINPYAANKRWERNIIFRKYLQKRLPGKIIDTQKDKEYTVRTVREMCKDHDIIVAAGGDGTIADVIQGIVESGKNDEVKLGVLPLGSGNAFCESIGIPKLIWKAIDLIHYGDVKEMDLIDIGGKVASFGSVGATAQILIEKLRHNIPGFFGHILASRIMMKLSRQNQEVEMIDGRDDEGNRFERKVMNLKVFDAVFGKTNHFGYRWNIAPRARIDDGYVDVTFFEISSWKYLLYFPGIYFGTFQKTQRHYKAKRIIIRGKNLPVQYNGELLGIQDEIEVKILPKALKILSRHRGKRELFAKYRK